MHNSFLGCYHRVGLRSLYVMLVYCISWLGSGLAWGLNIISMIVQTFLIDIDIGIDVDVDVKCPLPWYLDVTHVNHRTHVGM